MGLVSSIVWTAVIAVVGLPLALVAALLFAHHVWAPPPKRTAKSPPLVSGSVPFVGCGLAFGKNPRQFLADCRKKHGDVFCLYLFGFQLVFVFSNSGLRALYSTPESDASFVEATKSLLGLKLPPEVLQANNFRSVSRVLRRDYLSQHTAVVTRCVLESLADLRASAAARNRKFEVFTHMKSLVHRLSLRSWAGEAAASQFGDRIIRSFEKLDPEQAFVAPLSLFRTVMTGKADEKAALADIKSCLAEVWRNRQQSSTDSKLHDNLSELWEVHSDIADDNERMNKVAIDVFMLHVASQSNLYAALSWLIINLLEHADARAAVLAEISAGRAKYGPEFGMTIDSLDDMVFTEAAMNEGIRIAQQSLTLRKVMTPLVVDGFELLPTQYLSTLLSVTNTSPEFVANQPTKFVPTRYDKSGLTELGGADKRFGVSSFGHGTHACPGRRLAFAVGKIVLIHYLTELTMTPCYRYSDVHVIDTQMGAVGRAALPCWVEYQSVVRS